MKCAATKSEQVLRADFDRFESYTGVVAGQKRVEDARGRAFVPATPNFRTQSKDNRGGRD
jgi:hypothetical protein